MTVAVCCAVVCVGGVYKPLLLIVPSVAVQVTACDGLAVPATTAVNCWLRVALEGDTVTLLTDETFADEGVTAFDAADAGEVPAALVAVTVKV